MASGTISACAVRHSDVRLSIQRRDYVSAPIKPLWHFEAQLARNEHGSWRGTERVQLGACLATDLQNVAAALCGGSILIVAADHELPLHGPRYLRQ